MATTCIYCGDPCRATREHLVPKWLLRVTTHHTFRFLDCAPAGVVTGDPVIKDVCGKCNGGPLSALDSYAKTLYDSYFDERFILEPPHEFTYNFPKLARWLLKISYNVARTRRDGDRVSLSRFSDYIRAGGEPGPLAVFLEIVSPHFLTAAEEARVSQKNKELCPLIGGRRAILPKMIRVAKAVSLNECRDVCLRLVSINNYYFYVVAPLAAEVTPKEWQSLRRAVKRELSQSVQLTPNAKTVVLCKRREDFLLSYAPTLVVNRARLS